MKRKRRCTRVYNDAVLKMGYEEMAQINLGFAESGLRLDADDYVSYEKVLAAGIMEAEGVDD